MAKKAYYINSTLARYTDEEFAWFQTLFLKEGVVGAAVGGALGFQVLEQTPVPSMILRVLAGKGLIELTKEGRTFKCVVESTATETVTVAGNSTGSNRVDAIILRLDKDAEPDALKANVFTIEVVTGSGVTALTDGAIDTIVNGDGWYRIADVTVANGAVQIFNASIADTRVKVSFTDGLAFAQAFIASSAGVSDANKYPMLNALGLLDASFLKTAKRTWFFGTHWGDSTTRFDITKTGNTVRYTWDGTGTNPLIDTTNTPVGATVNINAQNFTAANNLVAVITAVGANYFEITNAAGVVESDKTVGTGSIKFRYVPSAGAVYSQIELQGAGASASGDSGSGYSGSAGGYARALKLASAVANTDFIVGRGAVGSRAVGVTGGTTSFGSISATGGVGGDGGAPGSGVGGDLNLMGDYGYYAWCTGGGSYQQFIGSRGGKSYLGVGGTGAPTPTGYSDTTKAGSGYLGGGGGGCGIQSTYGLGDESGGDAGHGCVIITEL